jgi:hypothetical protein
MVACQEKKLGVPAKIETTPGISAIYQIEPSNSTTDWTIDKQKINIPITDGRFSVLDGVLTTGNIELDVENLSIKEPKTENTAEAVAVLKDTTYFDTKISSVGRLLITKIERTNAVPNATHLVSCDFTLKNTSKMVQIPVQIQISEQEFTMNSNAPVEFFPLEWGILGKDKKAVWRFSLTLKAQKQTI